MSGAAIKGGQGAAHPVDEIASDFAVVVVFDQAFQASMADAPYSHAFQVYGNAVYVASQFVLNLGAATGNKVAGAPSSHVKHFGGNRAASLGRARKAV